MAIRSCAIERTKTGLPCVWECGGGFSNSGDATIICGPHGEKKKALVVRTRGELACKNHALFVAKEGDLLVRASFQHGEMSITIQRFSCFAEAEAMMEDVASYEHGVWDHEPAPEIDEACQAAAEKCRDYHCRYMYWGIAPEKRY